MNFGFFSELLAEDAAEEVSGEESKQKKRNYSDNKEGNIDTVREGPERILNPFFPGEDQKQNIKKNKKDKIEKEKLEEFDRVIHKFFNRQKKRIYSVVVAEIERFKILILILKSEPYRIIARIDFFQKRCGYTG